MKRGGLQQKRFVPRPAGDCWSPAGLGRPTASWRPWVARRPWPCQTVPSGFPIFFLIFDFFWTYEELLGILKKWVYNTPIFWSLPFALGSVKCSILHGDWRFHFFSNFIFSTFRVHFGIFVLWEIEITKNSSRIANIMEIFYTLLQCMVHLSMFQSSSTSKIWYTSAWHDVHYDGAIAQSCIV
jgi:hypothetical protein